MPGPPPKRSSQRRRRNKTDIEKARGYRADPPESDPDWHPVASQWFDSLRDSGQSIFYEASDWATAYMIAESMTRELKPKYLGSTKDGEAIIDEAPITGASLSAWLKAMSSLLVTEGDRRRVKVELEKSPEVDPHEESAIADLDSFRKRVASD